MGGIESFVAARCLYSTLGEMNANVTNFAHYIVSFDGKRPHG